MNRDIKRSKTLRMWHKYKNIVYLMLAVLVIIVLIVVGISKAVGGNEKESQSQSESESVSESQSASQQASEEASQQAATPTTEAPTTEAPTTEPPTTEAPTSATDIVKTPQKEDFQNDSFFSDAAFVGDVFVAGMDIYQHLDSSRLVYNEQWTTGKASNNVDKIAATNASKVFIQLGLNDLNNGKKASSVFESYKELVADIKAKLPNATIYVVSTFPVTTGFEAKETTTITNAEVKSLNELLSTMEGVTYLDVAASISNSDGSLNTDLSASGYNIVNSYYGFILNLIAEMCQ